MKSAFKAVKITDRVYWVGAIDWAVRDFHGYLTTRGTTYNAYLIVADRITLVDTVKAGFFEEMHARIASVVDPEKIDVLISNHAEPDHSGELLQAMEKLAPAEVYASRAGHAALDLHYGVGDRVRAVESGSSLMLGDVEVVFADTKMCHWPDSMVTYLPADELLFSQDAFGMHLAGYERFADQVDPALLDAEAAKYYANILLPLSKAVARTLSDVTASNWTLKIVAPDHGPIWRENPCTIIEKYIRWSRQERTNKAVVLYDTMWNSTDLMARAVGEGLASGGATVRLMPVRGVHRSDVAAEFLDAGAIVVGAPTLNSEIFPTLADVLTYLKGLRPEGLVGATFGSFGWSGQASDILNEFLQKMRVEMVAAPVKSKYVPADETLTDCYDLGRKVAQRLAETSAR